MLASICFQVTSSGQYHNSHHALAFASALAPAFSAALAVHIPLLVARDLILVYVAF